MIRPAFRTSVEETVQYFAEDFENKPDLFCDSPQGPLPRIEWIGDVTGFVSEPILRPSLKDFQAFLQACRPILASIRLTPKKAKNKALELVDTVMKSVAIVAEYDDNVKRAVLTRFRRIVAPLVLADAHVRDREDQAEHSSVVATKMMGISFLHDSSRAADPHPHSHNLFFCFAFDPLRKKWFSLEPSRIYENLALYQAVADSYLFGELKRLGYRPVMTARGPDIPAIPLALIKAFSSRHEAIVAEAEKIIARIAQMDGGAIFPPDEKTMLERSRQLSIHEIQKRIAQDLRPTKSKESKKRPLSPEIQKLLHETIYYINHVKHTTFALPIIPASPEQIAKAITQLTANDRAIRRQVLISSLMRLLPGAVDLMRAEAEVDVKFPNQLHHSFHTFCFSNKLSKEADAFTRNAASVSSRQGTYRSIPDIPHDFPRVESSILATPTAISVLDLGRRSALAPILKTLHRQQEQQVFCARPSPDFPIPELVQQKLDEPHTTNKISIFLIEEADELSLQEISALHRLAVEKRTTIVLTVRAPKKEKTDVPEIARPSNFVSTALLLTQEQHFAHPLPLIEAYPRRMLRPTSSTKVQVEQSPCFRSEPGSTYDQVLEFAAQHMSSLLHEGKKAVLVTPTAADTQRANMLIRKQLNEFKIISKPVTSVQQLDPIPGRPDAIEGGTVVYARAKQNLPGLKKGRLVRIPLITRERVQVSVGKTLREYRGSQTESRAAQHGGDGSAGAVPVRPIRIRQRRPDTAAVPQQEFWSTAKAVACKPDRARRV